MELIHTCCRNDNHKNDLIQLLPWEYCKLVYDDFHDDSVFLEKKRQSRHWYFPPGFQIKSNSFNEIMKLLLDLIKKDIESTVIWRLLTH